MNRRRHFLPECREAPAPRFLAAAAGAAIAIHGMRRGGIIGTGAAAAGLVLLMRALANMELKQMIGHAVEKETASPGEPVPVGAA